MRPTDTVQRVVELLAERGVNVRSLAPREVEGAGADARMAWEAFKVMVAEPAYDPFDDDYGTDQVVEHEELGFETYAASAWTTYDGKEFPPTFRLSVLRQFEGGEQNEGLFGPELGITFALPPDSELWRLNHNESDGPLGENFLSPSFAAEWFEKIERLDCFQIPMTGHEPTGFHVYQRSVG